MIVIQPPTASFLLSRAELSLPEVAWAVQQSLIGAQTAIDIAVDLVARGNSDAQTVRVASVGRSELADVTELLPRLRDDRSKFYPHKWLWLYVMWVAEQYPADSEELFEAIDQLYELFEYPSEMSEFGPYAAGYAGLSSQQERTAYAKAEMERFISKGYSIFGRESGDAVTSSLRTT